MTVNASKLLFDAQDYELLAIVNGVLRREGARRKFKGLLQPYLHPNGIKELAASKDLRVAYAVIHLLDSLTEGRAEDRLGALRAVRDEVLHCAQSSLRINTGRVLLEIMKELVRTPQSRRQLELAHDFRVVSSGKPVLVRRLLRRYHLLEMPEDSSQITFDDHVHDANTKGRKFPTHLIMDAWIKGIRSLTVIHYNHVRAEALSELLEAADIMGIKVRIGVEYSCLWRNRLISLIWSPRGFSGAQDFMDFLQKPQIQELMERGRKVSEFQQGRVLDALECFNRKGRQSIKEELGLELAPLMEEEFLAFVGTGQASMMHFSQCVQGLILAAMDKERRRLKESLAGASEARRQVLAARLTEVEQIQPSEVMTRYLTNPQGACFTVMRGDDPGLPEMVRQSPSDLLKMLSTLHSGARVTLNLTGLGVEDVLELVNECRGGITHLEIFNLKDYVREKSAHLSQICRLQQILNSGNPIIIKQFIREIMDRLEGSEDPDAAERLEGLAKVLRNIENLCAYYMRVPLKSRLGSDSTGHSSYSPAMGLAVLETLPPGVQRRLSRKQEHSRPRLPIHTTVHQQITYRKKHSDRPWREGLLRILRKIPGLRIQGLECARDWLSEDHSYVETGRGNLISLGGGFQTRDEDPPANGSHPAGSGLGHSWAYLNTGIKNFLKVLIGFIPAALAFCLFHDWWVLAWLGAPIWFAITGLRNIVQSVLGGGGIRRSPVLRWKDYVSWERLADSLMFTGFSVPLLDYLVKTLLLKQGMGITTNTDPLVLYTVMSLVNGLYISSHNLFRGLPRSAVIGNFFRSILSIPLALLLNWGLGGLLAFYEVPQVDDMLQRWAAVISKAASDTVAGFIEGLADRMRNINLRALDYRGKLKQVLETFARLEVRFPETDALKMLAQPKMLLHHSSDDVRHLGDIMIINALDLMYFWMYQPRAQTVFRALSTRLSQEEREIINLSQLVLSRQREVSQLFLDGLVGNHFSRALSFYLDRWSQYLNICRNLLDHIHPHNLSGKESGLKLR